MLEAIRTGSEKVEEQRPSTEAGLSGSKSAAQGQCRVVASPPVELRPKGSRGAQRSEMGVWLPACLRGLEKLMPVPSGIHGFLLLPWFRIETLGYEPPSFDYYCNYQGLPVTFLSRRPLPSSKLRLLLHLQDGTSRVFHQMSIRQATLHVRARSA